MTNDEVQDMELLKIIDVLLRIILEQKDKKMEQVKHREWLQGETFFVFVEVLRKLRMLRGLF